MSIPWTPTGGTDWTGMGPEAFDQGTAPEQGSLFGLTVDLVKPKTGPQLDLFSEETSQ